MCPWGSFLHRCPLPLEVGGRRKIPFHVRRCDTAAGSVARGLLIQSTNPQSGGKYSHLRTSAHVGESCGINCDFLCLILDVAPFLRAVFLFLFFSLLSLHANSTQRFDFTPFVLFLRHPLSGSLGGDNHPDAKQRKNQLFSFWNDLHLNSLSLKL